MNFCVPRVFAGHLLISALSIVYQYACQDCMKLTSADETPDNRSLQHDVAKAMHGKTCRQRLLRSLRCAIPTTEFPFYSIVQSTLYKYPVVYPSLYSTSDSRSQEIS